MALPRCGGRDGFEAGVHPSLLYAWKRQQKQGQIDEMRRKDLVLF